jgi:hypothetical protein
MCADNYPNDNVSNQLANKLYVGNMQWVENDRE